MYCLIFNPCGFYFAMHLKQSNTIGKIRKSMTNYCVFCRIEKKYNQRMYVRKEIKKEWQCHSILKLHISAIVCKDDLINNNSLIQML